MSARPATAASEWSLGAWREETLSLSRPFPLAATSPVSTPYRWSGCARDRRKQEVWLPRGQPARSPTPPPQQQQEPEKQQWEPGQQQQLHFPIPSGGGGKGRVASCHRHNPNCSSSCRRTDALLSLLQQQQMTHERQLVVFI